MLIGKIVKDGNMWAAEVEAIGAFTAGTSRRDAADMLVDLIQMMVDVPDFEVDVSEIDVDDDGAYIVNVDSNRPALLAAQVLRYQREVRQLSLADVAEKLGYSTRSSYANYEQGRVQPTLGKFRELLAAVAPDMTMTIGPIALKTR